MRFVSPMLFFIFVLGAINISTNSVDWIATSQSKSKQPSPRSHLNFTPGDDRTIADWQQITDYFSRLDKTSDRISVKTLGKTTLNRPLIVAFISSPDNIRDLQKYQEIQRKLADPRTIRDETERDMMLENGKTVVAVSCSIHSDEIVASQMSMQLAYEMATAQDAATQEVLKNTILLLIPSANPDGIDIVANWYRKVLGTPQEGTVAPELFHHYAGHDNNRDWFMLNLKETQLMSRFFWKEWFPQIVYDIHQQNSASVRFTVHSFYEPAIPNIVPILNNEIKSINLQIASDIHRAGFNDVFTGAPCDGNRHGSLRTASYYHNAIGILSETMSAEIMSPLTRRRTRSTSDGSSSQSRPPLYGQDARFLAPWRPRDIMETEMSATRSLLTAAAKNRDTYLRNHYELGRANLSAPIYWPRAYLIPAGQGADEAVAMFIGALVGQGIEVYRLERELHVTSTSSIAHRMSARTMREVPAGSYIVFLSQPYASLIRALFQPLIYSGRCVDNKPTPPADDVIGGPLPMQMGLSVEVIQGILEPENERRLTLISHQAEVYRDLGLLIKDGEGAFTNPITQAVRLAVYQSSAGSTDEGWTRFILDTFNVPYKSLPDRDLTSRNLREQYDVIILPSLKAAKTLGGAYPSEFTDGISDAGIEILRNFVQNGGVLICLKAASELIIEKLNLPLQNVLQKSTAFRSDTETSILRLKVDLTHPIARLMPLEIDVSFNNGAAYEFTSNAHVRSIARYAEKDTFRSGLLSDEALIKGRVAIAEISLGKGRILLFGFNPQHRGQIGGGLRLLFNSIASGVNKSRSR